MNNNIIKVLFVPAKNRINKVGRCIVKCRIFHNKQRKEFSTGLFINPYFWQSKQQLVVPLEPDNEYINNQLSLIRTKLNQAFLFLQVRDIDFNVQDIYIQYKGETNKDLKGRESI